MRFFSVGKVTYYQQESTAESFFLLSSSKKSPIMFVSVAKFTNFASSNGNKH